MITQKPFFTSANLIFPARTLTSSQPITQSQKSAKPRALRREDLPMVKSLDVVSSFIVRAQIQALHLVVFLYAQADSLLDQKEDHQAYDHRPSDYE